jgi:hypothetical protein
MEMLLVIGDFEKGHHHHYHGSDKCKWMDDLGRATR